MRLQSSLESNFISKDCERKKDFSRVEVMPFLMTPTSEASPTPILPQGEEQNRVFLTNISSSSSPVQELGHQVVDLRWSEAARSACLGFLVGIASHNTRLNERHLNTTIPILVGIETFVEDYAKDLRYDHEYAREVWEHEFNSIGEVDEYVAYAVAQGISPDKARDIALSVTSEPKVSVPYHLAFELGLVQPPLYRRKLIHSIVTSMGFFGGMMASDASAAVTTTLMRRINIQAGNAALGASIALAIMTPVVAFRFRHIRRVAGADRFRTLMAITYGVTLGLLIYVTRKT